MKFRINFKDPDGVHDSISEIIKDSLATLRAKVPEEFVLEDEGFEEVYGDAKRKELEPTLDKWLRYNEYITIEFDTETGTATVIPAK